IADYNHFVLSFADQSGQLDHFVVGSSSARAEQHPNATFRKIPHELAQDRNHRVVLLPHAEKHLVIRIVLPAETREVLVRLGIQPANRLKITDRRSEVTCSCASTRVTAKELPRTEQRNEIVDERDGSDGKQHVFDARNHRLLLLYNAALNGLPARRRWRTGVSPVQ